MNMMIVDDSSMLQSRLKDALRKVDKNMKITQAATVREASEMFFHFKPETVILDIALPDGSGIDLLRKFKKEKPSAKVIIFTNYPTDEFKKSCLALGADHFIDKSNMRGLINIIQQGI